MQPPFSNSNRKSIVIYFIVLHNVYRVFIVGLKHLLAQYQNAQQTSAFAPSAVSMPPMFTPRFFKSKQQESALEEDSVKNLEKESGPTDESETTPKDSKNNAVDNAVVGNAVDNSKNNAVDDVSEMEKKAKWDDVEMNDLEKRVREKTRALLLKVQSELTL